MKPRTKLDKRAQAALKHLPELSPKQIEWAKDHLFAPEAYWSKKEAWCSKCGGVIPLGDDSLLVNALATEEVICPHCGKRLKPVRSRRRKIHEANYLTIITTCRGLQVQRNFEVICNGRKGEGVNYLFHEVVQLWLDESGAESFFACNRAPFSMYLDRWTWGTLSCKHRQSYYYGNPWLFMGVVYPHWRALPILKRNGYKPINGVLPHSHMKLLLNEPKAETLQKAGQNELLRYMVDRGWRAAREWHAVKIALRNGYIVEDAPSWVDYIDELRELGLDTHSPKYVCPADLQAAHRRTSRRVERKREAERHEENRKKAASYESAYWEEKNKFFGMVISDGAITIRPLLSVMEFADEAAAMHHCVFSGEYFKRKTSLILTARNAADKRLETIEFDLRSFRVLQSRGVNNSNTENHDHILSLVNSNINTIKKYAHDKT